MTKPLTRWYEINPDKTTFALPEGEYPAFTSDRIVGNDTVDKARISTVFLGMDHDLLSEHEKPILFETMVFGGEYDSFQTRYSTYDQALEGHNKIVNSLKDGIDPNESI